MAETLNGAGVESVQGKRDELFAAMEDEEILEKGAIGENDEEEKGRDRKKENEIE